LEAKSRDSVPRTRTHAVDPGSGRVGWATVAVRADGSRPVLTPFTSLPWAVAAVAVALTTTILGWRGADWPAAVYRVTLFRRFGWIGFDTGWYGGHAPVAYSSLFPPLAATIGVRTTALACAGIATWAFDRFTVRQFGSRARIGTLCFAAGAVVQVVVGQLAFLLGLTFALATALAVTTGRRRLALLGAVAAGLSSPVAALFLAIGTLTWTLGTRQHLRDALTLAGAALLPVAVVDVVYAQGGRFPFPLSSLACVLVACVLAWLVLPREEQVLRAGAIVYAAASLALFVIPTPVGGLMTRLGTTIGVPLVWSAIRRAPRFAIAGLAALTLVWQLAPATGALGAAAGARPTEAYFAPLTTALRRAHANLGRVEIPLTQGHWEAAWVAPSIPLARGWERQLDMVDNPIFYRNGSITASAYRTWLDENGIGWVALPDLPLDPSARAEAALLRTRPSFLTPVWHDAHWQLWKVRGSTGLVSGAASLTALDANSFTIVATRPGPVDVRVRWTRTWTIDDGDGIACLERAAHDWTRVQVSRAGTVEVASHLLPTRSSSC
jgi:hypothetical protein